MPRGGAIIDNLRLLLHGPPVDAEVEHAFDVYCDVLIGRAAPWLLGFFVFVVVAWWPADLFLYADRPGVQRALALMRGGLVAHHVAWLTVGRRVLRRRAAVMGPLIAIAESWAVAWLGGRLGGLDSPWPYYMYIWPLMLVGLAKPLSTRVSLLLLLGLGALGCYLVASATPLDHPHLPATASYMLFCCLFAALVGHGLWLLLRENFVQRRLIEAQRARLDGFRRELEQRVRAQTRDLQVLTRRLETLREEERGWMAREMNDALGQELTGARFALDLVRARLGGGDAGLDGALVAIHDRLGRAHESVHGILARLRPPVLDALGLAAALRWLCEDTAARSAIAVECVARPPDARLPAPLEAALYRVTQEAVSNVLRHARATMMRVELTVDGGRCRLTVRDDGIGLAASRSPSAGVGCVGIRERMAAFGGWAVWQIPAGGGTALQVDVPLGGG